EGCPCAATSRRPLAESYAKWSIRPCIPGNAMRPESSSESPADEAASAHATRIKPTTPLRTWLTYDLTQSSPSVQSVVERKSCQPLRMCPMTHHRDFERTFVTYTS